MVVTATVGITMTRLKIILMTALATLIGWLAFTSRRKSSTITDLQARLIEMEVELARKRLQQTVEEKRREKINKARSSDFDPSSFDKSRLSDED